MKKTKIVILAVVIALSLAIGGCSSDNGIEDGTTNDNNRPNVTENGNPNADKNLTNENNG